MLLCFDTREQHPERVCCCELAQAAISDRAARRMSVLAGQSRRAERAVAASAPGAPQRRRLSVRGLAARAGVGCG